MVKKNLGISFNIHYSNFLFAENILIEQKYTNRK